MRRRAPYTIEEIPGETFPDLAAAQQAALIPLAAGLAATIQALLAAGDLVQVEGRIMRKDNKDA